MSIAGAVAAPVLDIWSENRELMGRRHRLIASSGLAQHGGRANLLLALEMGYE
jgi:hypothetical protein